VLSREDAGAERIFQNNGVPLLLNMVGTGKPEMVLAAVRTLSGMCTGHKARVSQEAVKVKGGIQEQFKPMQPSNTRDF